MRTSEKLERLGYEEIAADQLSILNDGTLARIRSELPAGSGLKGIEVCVYDSAGIMHKIIIATDTDRCGFIVAAKKGAQYV